MKKTSFIRRLFLSLTILYLIIFIGMFVFQRVIFQRIYTNRVIRTTITEINDAFETLPESDISEVLVDFSQATQTTAVIIPAQELKNDINALSLLVAEVTTLNNSTIRVFLPNRMELESALDKEISGTLYLHEPSGIYVPSSLWIDQTRIIHSKRGHINMMYGDIISDLDLDSKRQFTGVITNIQNPQDIGNPIINPLVSNEVLNLISENYENTTKFDNGFYYTSMEENSSLVFYSNQIVDGNNLILIAIYPLSHIQDILTAMQLVNIYIFIAVFLVLLFSSFVYTKQFSTPIMKINNATRELSNLNFDTHIDLSEKNDEFNEIANNIMELSHNLEQTLTKLNQQNKHLSESLDRENTNESNRIDFIRGMSHELKTPLAVIQASSEAVQNNVYHTSEDRNNALDLINKEVQKISKMINEMMHVYKLDTANYINLFTHFDLSDVFNTYLSDMNVLLERKELSFESKIHPAMVFGDKEKLGMCMSNLLSNAIKYTPNKGKIRVTIQEQGTSTLFQIENTGVHIDEDKLNLLFEPFYRLDNARSREEGNSGLGLYIVQQTLAQHDSKCLVSNTEDGVLFEFKIKSSE